MIQLQPFEFTAPTARPVEELVIHYSTIASNWAESLSAVSTCAAAVFAAVAVVVAFRTSRADKKRHRQQEVREATAGMIQAIHTLAVRSRDTTRDNEADRNEAYQQSVLFDLAAGPELNRVRFNAAISWILRASGHRRYAAEALEGMNYFEVSRYNFIDALVREMTESLRIFDASGGEIDPTPDIARRFEKVFSDRSYKSDKRIHISLVSPDKIYRTLVGSDIPTWNNPEQKIS